MPPLFENTLASVFDPQPSHFISFISAIASDLGLCRLLYFMFLFILMTLFHTIEVSNFFILLFSMVKVREKITGIGYNAPDVSSGRYGQGTGHISRL